MAVALWAFGLRPDILALPLAFSAAFFYFSPAGYAFLSSKDLLRAALILILLLAPIRVAWRSQGSRLRWHAAYLPTLDGWRAVAILIVILDHLLQGIAAIKRVPPPTSLLLGQHGVNIFFGISGLLITWKLLEEHQQTGSISLPGFYRRRVFRIFPPALAFLAVAALLSVAGWMPTTRLELASTVLYFRNFLPVYWPSFSNAHFWSLSLEEQFYLLMPAALVWLGMRRLRTLATGLVALCALWRWYYFHFLAGADPALSLRLRTDFRIDGLLCGCLMAIFLQEENVKRVVRKVFSTPVWLLLLVVFAGLIYWAGIRTLLAESIIIPLLLAGTMLTPQALPGRILEWKPVRWVGRISYSLYLWQQIFLLCPVDHGPLRPLVQFPLNLVTVFFCATCSYYLLERPMLRRAQSQISKPSPLPIPASAAIATD